MRNFTIIFLFPFIIHAQNIEQIRGEINYIYSDSSTLSYYQEVDNLFEANSYQEFEKYLDSFMKSFQTNKDSLQKSGAILSKQGNLYFSHKSKWIAKGSFDKHVKVKDGKFIGYNYHDFNHQVGMFKSHQLELPDHEEVQIEKNNKYNMTVVSVVDSRHDYRSIYLIKDGNIVGYIGHSLEFYPVRKDLIEAKNLDCKYDCFTIRFDLGYFWLKNDIEIKETEILKEMYTKLEIDSIRNSWKYLSYYGESNNNDFDIESDSIKLKEGGFYIIGTNGSRVIGKIDNGKKNGWFNYINPNDYLFRQEKYESDSLKCVINRVYNSSYFLLN